MKKNRLDDILNLINEHEIDTQDELTEKLNVLGYNVSQATVSRDIKQLNLVKAPGVIKKFKYVKSVSDFKISDKFKNLFKQVTLSISVAKNLVVVKTMSGNASTAGMAVDGMNIKEIMGTIAGDDTLLIVSKSDSEAEIIKNTLRNLCLNADKTNY